MKARQWPGCAPTTCPRHPTADHLPTSQARLSSSWLLPKRSGTRLSCDTCASPLRPCERPTVAPNAPPSVWRLGTQIADCVLRPVCP
eukprot:4426388-Prymnesium_polylepis.1